MTPEEKWFRLNNPKTLEDYGLSLSEDELRTFPEGVCFIEAVEQIRNEERCINLIANTLALNARSTVDNVIDKILKEAE